MSGAKRCDEVLRLIDETLADVQDPQATWRPDAPLPTVPPRFDPDLQTAAHLVAAGQARPSPVSTAA